MTDISDATRRPIRGTAFVATKRLGRDV